MGIELELFSLQEVAVHYQCMVCKDIPEIAPSCLRVMCNAGHIICTTCVDPLKPPSKCYLCSLSVVNRYGTRDWINQANPAIERLIKDLEVKCTKHEEGCAWKGKCNDLRTHEKTKCQHRVEPCKYAARGCKFSDLPAKTQAHKPLCDYRDVTCYRSRTWDFKTCKVTHRFNETQKHREQDCRYHICPYSTSGCRFYGKLADVENHQRLYCAPMHAKLAKLEATIASDTLISETKRVRQTVEKQLSQYKKRIAALEQDLKLAKADASVLTMQQTAGLPLLKGQARALEPSLGPSILLSVTSTSTSSSDPPNDASEASEEAWNEVHWTEPDWTLADQQAKKAKRPAMTDISNKAISQTQGRKTAANSRTRTQ